MAFYLRGRWAHDKSSKISGFYRKCTEFLQPLVSGSPLCSSSSEPQQWSEIAVTGPGSPGQAPGWQKPSSAGSLQETQAHILIRNQDNAGHTLHLPCLRGQDHLVLLHQLGGKMRMGWLKSVIFIYCPPSHAPTLCLPSSLPQRLLYPSLDHIPPASPHSPLPAAVASPALQSCDPGNPGPHSRRAQSQMGVGPRVCQADSSSASDGVGSFPAQGRC